MTGEIRASSFYLPLCFLPARARRDMHALYAFCREADDAADKAAGKEEAHAALNALRAKIAQAYSEPVEGELAKLVQRYDLRRDYFSAILDGMEMDISGQMLRPTLSNLTYYCYRVASCVGLLALPIMGMKSPEAEQFAIALGLAMQHTNILRDLKEDAARGRIYLPREWLEEEGIGDIAPGDLDNHYKAITLVCISVAERAERYFEEAESLSRELNRRRLLSALLMRDVYHFYLRSLTKRRAFLAPHDLRLGAWRKLLLVLGAAWYL